MSALPNVKVVNWEETEEYVTEEPPPFPVTTFLSHGRERCAPTNGAIDTAYARTLAGTRWFEKFEVELKKYATTVEVVPDSQTFRFGPGAVKKSSRAIIYPVAVGQTVFLLRASFLDVIDVAEKTIEFQTFQNVKVPLEVVAGHLTMDLQPKHASDIVDATDVGTCTNRRLPLLFDRLQKRLVWPYPQSHIFLPQLPHSRKTLTITKVTRRTVRQMFRVVIFKPQVCRTI